MFWPTPRTDRPRPAQARPLAGSAVVWCETQDPDLWSRPRPVLSLPHDRPLVMGILNVTPDSFSDGGTLTDPVATARAMVAAGADILDIGGESTRPGAPEVPVADEIARTAPVITALRAAGIATPVSIDTRKAAVARAALDAGAQIVNDVSGLTFDPDLGPLVAARGVPVILMHMRGTPATMQEHASYGDVLAEVMAELAARRDAALAAGIGREKIILDPGIGFAKTLEHNLALIRDLAALHALGAPLLLGASRKRFIGTLTGETIAAHRLGGSIAAALAGAAQGAHILRVHDVKETVDALRLWRALAGDPA
jgi:dihydropteroate synthase